MPVPLTAGSARRPTLRFDPILPKQTAFEIEDAAANNNLDKGRNTFKLLEAEFEKLCRAVSYENEYM